MVDLIVDGFWPSTPNYTQPNRPRKSLFATHGLTLVKAYQRKAHKMSNILGRIRLLLLFTFLSSGGWVKITTQINSQAAYGPREPNSHVYKSTSIPLRKK